jgi:hypothetical protein
MTDLERVLELVERLARRVASFGRSHEDHKTIQDIEALRAELKRDAEMAGR